MRAFHKNGSFETLVPKNGEASPFVSFIRIHTITCALLDIAMGQVEVEAVIFVHETCKHELYAIHSLVLTVCKKDNPSNY